jgi:hypothetical protein
MRLENALPLLYIYSYEKTRLELREIFKKALYAVSINSQLWAQVVVNTGYVRVSARGSVVCWGTMLQAGRTPVWFPMRSLGFSVDLILTAAL